MELEFENKLAQGTIEYLVVLAVIVVVSLVVVSLLVNSTMPAQGISSAVSTISATSNPIAIKEAVINEDGDYFLTLKNNTGENLVISKINVGNKLAEPSKNLFVGGEGAFLITSEMVCNEGEVVVNEINVTYLTSNGLVKTQTYPVPVYFECTNYSPNVPYTDEEGNDYSGEGVLQFNCTTQPSGFYGGDGSEANPYEICSWAQLSNMRNYLSDNYSYKLIKSLSSSDEDYALFAGPSANSGQGWEPVGLFSSRFFGKVYGNNQTISDLYINRNTVDGLFGSTENLYVEKLGLNNIDIVGGIRTGGLAGILVNGNIIDSNVSGTVSGPYVGTGGIGGLVGVISSGNIENCNSSANVSGLENTGGLVGNATGSGQIVNSYSTGDVSDGVGGNRTGGLVGQLSGSGFSLIDSYSTANVNGTDVVGGLVGWVGNSYVLNSRAFGDVNGTCLVGGLVGFLLGNVDNAIIENSYSVGNVSGEISIGGLVGTSGGSPCFTGSGYYGGKIINSYSLGDVNRTAGTNTRVGGFLGANIRGVVINSYSLGSVFYEGEADPTNKGFIGLQDTAGDWEDTGNFWNTTTSNQVTTTGNAQGITSSQMKQQQTFTNAGWNFTTVWEIQESTTYPYLQENIPENYPQ